MYIARFTEDKIQTIKEHLSGVSSYCYDFTKEIGLSSLCQLCGLLHDLGKYSDEFQTYIKQAQLITTQGTYKQWITKVKKVDHGVYGAKYLFEEFKDVKGMRQCTRDIIGEVICYHHGGLPDNLNSNNEIPLIKRMENVSEENLLIVLNRFYSEFREVNIFEIFEQASVELEEFLRKCISVEVDLQIGLGFIIKYIYSCVVDADRLDSFCFESGYLESQINEQELWNKYAYNLEGKLLEFAKQEPNSVLEETVKSMRESVSDACKEGAKNPKGLYTLTVPTGGGKTFASMRFALHHAIKYKKKKIIYVMPYTTIVEQNADEIRKILNCQQQLLEFHSNVLDDTKDDEYEILGERFSSPIIFTTMVQFLNVLFASGNGNIRKMHQFENSVIIFDEIQALPIKCTALFYQAINFFTRMANTTCVLCTATQPYYKYIKEKFEVEIDGEIIPNVDEIFQNLKRMNLIDMTQDEMTAGEVVDFILKLKEADKSVLCVMNTVQTVIDIYEGIISKQLNEVEVYILTTRMCPLHRKRVIADMKTSLREKRHVICISTQLIEAGVDISFEKIVRGLANLDSIAQSAGRGNRHGEREISEVYVVKLSDEKLSVLSDIKIGQEHTENIFYYYKQNSERYKGDLLSSKSISEYYRRFYEDNEVNKKMKYPLKGQNEINLYDLLVNARERMRRRENFELTYTVQFETARRNFRVIESNTRTIIVPYNEEAKSAIAILLSNRNVNEKYQVLKTLQKYTVNIYENLYRDLITKKAFIENNMEGVDILSEEYYLSDKGVTGNKKLTIMMY